MFSTKYTYIIIPLTCYILASQSHSEGYGTCGTIHSQKKEMGKWKMSLSYLAMVRSTPPPMADRGQTKYYMHSSAKDVH